MRLNFLLIILLSCNTFFGLEDSEAQSNWTFKKIAVTSALVIGAGGLAVVAAPVVGAATISGATAVAGAKATVVTIAGLKKAAMGVLVAKSVWFVGKSAYQCFYPTDEQRIKQIQKEDWYTKSLEQQIADHRARAALNASNSSQGKDCDY